jgi:hypothetical protein
MLTQATIENTIATSLDIIRHRLDWAPISAEAIERVYGLDVAAAQDLAQPGRMTIDRVNMHVTFTVSCISCAAACLRVADLLSGLDSSVKLRLYTPDGTIARKTVESLPDLVGVINGRSRGDGTFVFRLPAEGQEVDWSRGLPVTTVLWCCSEEAVDLIDQYRDCGGFDQWKRDHAYPLTMVGNDSFGVLHLDCIVQLTAERLHALAVEPEVSSITNLAATFAFK